MCDCSSLNAHLLLGDSSGGRPRTRPPSRCYLQALSAGHLLMWGSGGEALRSELSGYGTRLLRQRSRVIRKTAPLSGYFHPLPRRCSGAGRGERCSIWVVGCSGDYRPERYGHLKGTIFSRFDGERAENGRRSPGDGERSSGDASVPSTPDVLELKRELHKEQWEKGSSGVLENGGNLIPSGDNRKTISESEDEDRADRMSLPRSGRQMIRRSNLIAKQVISVESARSLGFISELWVDTPLWVVVLAEVKLNLLSGETEKFLLEDVHQVGDVVLVQDESVVENELKMIGLDTLVGYNVVTTGRRNIGKVRGYNFDVNSGAVESLELDSFGMSIIPSSLVSTYCLLVEDVIEVLSDTIVVHEGAASRLQRLTKGFWDAPKSEASWEEIEDFVNFRRRTNRSLRRQSRGRDFRSRKSQEDWDLPMDF